jgi:hypothetical protein
MKTILLSAASMILGLLVAQPQAFSGDLLGTTYSSSKYGSFEISSPDGKWMIKDEDSKSPNVCQLDLKEKVANSIHKPKIKVQAIGNPGGALDDDLMVESVKDAISGMGAAFKNVERVRLAGKKVNVLTFDQDHPLGGKFKGRYYLLKGAKSYFMVLYMIHESAEKEAEPLLQGVLSTIKY